MTSESSPLILITDEGSGGSVSFPDSVHLELQQPKEGTTNINSKSSLMQTTLNIVKLCIGTGVLAIPFAATEGGLVFHIIGLCFIAMWNSYSVHRLLESRSYIQNYKITLGANESFDDEKEEAPKNTNEFGYVTWHAFGWAGLQLADSIMIMLMLGIIVAYEAAILGFVQATPFTSGSRTIDAIFMLILISPVLLVPNYESIAKISALGTGLIAAIFIFIGSYGLRKNGLEGIYSISWEEAWPKSFISFSNWFGVAVFGFGAVPFSYSIQESMTEPKKMMKAANISHSIVVIAYVIMGDFISIIFVQGVQGDILSELPNSSLPTIIRILMTIVILTTVPLIIIPAGDLVHDKLIRKPKGSSKGKSVYVIRFILALLCAVVSVSVPNFVYVVSFVGCFCVTLLSFAYPPILHMRCMYQFCSEEKRLSMKKMIVTDMILLTLGIIITIFTSLLTFKSMMEVMKQPCKNSSQLSSL